MNSRLFIGIVAVLVNAVTQVSGECEIVTLTWTNYPGGDGIAPFEIYGDNSTDSDHIPNRALLYSPFGNSYQAAVELVYIDQPTLEIVFDTTNKEMKLLMVEFDSMRAEAVRIKVRQEDGFTTFNKHTPDISSNADLEAWTRSNALTFFEQPRLANLSLIFDHCTQDAQKCQENVWVKNLKIMALVCRQVYPECECNCNGDPVVGMYDHVNYPIHPVVQGSTCMMSLTELPVLATDDFCGWKVDIVIGEDTNNDIYIKEAHVYLHYKDNQMNFKVNAAGIYDLGTGADLTGTQGAWWGTSQDNSGLNLFTLAVASTCSFRVSATNIAVMTEAKYMIHTMYTDMLRTADGLCGNCDGVQNDFHDANGNLIMSSLTRFHTMTGIYCTAPAPAPI